MRKKHAYKFFKGEISMDKFNFFPVKNEKLVELLQNKYAQHNFMKNLEELIIKKSDRLTDFDFKNLEYTGDSIGKQGFLVNKRFTGKLNIPNEVFERIFEASYYRNYYINLIEKRLVQDSLLKIEIKNEIKLECYKVWRFVNHFQHWILNTACCRQNCLSCLWRT